MIEFILYFLFVFFGTFIANKKNFLPNYSGDTHQKFFSEKKIPLIGGILILPLLFLIFSEKDIFFVIISCLILIVGFLSDSKILSSPNKRFILQLFVVSFFVFYSNIEVTPTRIEPIDKILQGNFLGLFFSIFCIMILINGSNFVDGLNGLLLGYFLIIIIFLYYFNLIDPQIIDQKKQVFLITAFLILLFLNYSNFFYLGDGGSYLTGFILGYILISIYNFELISKPHYNVISPYYIVLLLWYPCLENLFSLTRKLLSKKSPSSADNQHLHQLIYLYVKKRFNFKKNLLPNILSGSLINIFNIFLIFFSSMNIYQTKIQILLICIASFLYCLIYFLLKKKFNN